MENVTLRQQLEAYSRNGEIIGDMSHCHNFYDWFCSDASLERRSKALFAKVKKFIKAKDVDLDKTYVFFKNNCPCSGPLYDDFRICDIESGNVIFNVTPKSGHSGKAEMWGKENDWKEAIKVADTFAQLLK